MSEETQNTQPERAFLISEAAERYRLAPSSIWRYVALGRIHAIRVGGRTLIPAAEIARIDREGVAPVSRKEEREIMAARRAEQSTAA